VRVHGTGRVYILPFLARPWVCTTRAVRAVRTLVFAFFCAFSPISVFELAFGVNMKVLDNCVSFPMPLVLHQNDF